MKRWLCLVGLMLSSMFATAQTTPPVAYAAYVNPGSGFVPWSAALGSGAAATPPPAIALYCSTDGVTWTPCTGSGSGGGPPTGAAGGGLTGTYPDPGLDPTSVADAINGTSPSVSNLSARTSVYAARFGFEYMVDGFTSGQYGGIGQAPVAWSSGTDNLPCQEVSNSGIYYIATALSSTGATTPGTNSAIWYPLTVASNPSPTQTECAFYWALANAGTSTTGGSNAVLWFSGSNNNVYSINGPLVMPPIGPEVELLGTAQGDNGTPVQIKATAAMGTMILKPSLTSPASTPYSLRLENISLNGNNLAQEGFWFSGAKLGVVEHVRVSNMTGTTDWVRFGDSTQPSSEGYNYQWVVNDLQLNSSGGTPAAITLTVSGGVPSIAVNSPGTYNYYTVQGVLPTVYLWGTGASGTSNQPCTTMGTATPVMSGSGLASVTLTGFSGCGASGTQMFAKVPDIPAAAYGINVDDVTDSSFTDLVSNNVGQTAGIVVNHSGNSFLHAHPYGASIPVGIISNNQNMFVNTELDSLFMYGAEPNNYDNWSNTNFTYNALLLGAKGFYTSNHGTFNSLGSTCGGTAQVAQGFSLVTTSTGDIAHGHSAAYPSNFKVIGDQCDDISAVVTLPYVNPTFPLASSLASTATVPVISLTGNNTSGPLFYAGQSTMPTWTVPEFIAGNSVNNYAGNWLDFFYNTTTEAFSVGAQGNTYIHGLSALSSSSLTIDSSPITGGSATTTFPLFYLNKNGATAVSSFSTAGTELGVNAPNGFTGNFLDFHVNGGASVANLSATGAFTGNTISNGSIELISSTVRSPTTSTSITYQGGGDNGSGAGGSATFRGAQNANSSAAGSAFLQAGANTSTGLQGFASVQQSFTIAAATTVGWVMQMTTTADRVVAAALGATDNVGIATSVGGTAAQLLVASSGKVLVVFDGTPVVGDLACAPPAATGTIGLAHDNVLVACPAGQKLGVITGQVSGTGSGATATVLLQLGS